MNDGKHWPLIIIGMLVCNAIAMAIIVVASSSSETHHVKSNYYQEALDWDAHMAQQRMNARLGWHAQLSVAALDETDGAIELSLTDRYDRPIAGAIVELRSFHLARASEVRSGDMLASKPGQYRVGLPMKRDGLWKTAIVVTYDDITFTHEQTLELVRPVAEAGRGPG